MEIINGINGDLFLYAKSFPIPLFQKYSLNIAAPIKFKTLVQLAVELYSVLT